MVNLRFYQKKWDSSYFIYLLIMLSHFVVNTLSGLMVTDWRFLLSYELTLFFVRLHFRVSFYLLLQALRLCDRSLQKGPQPFILQTPHQRCSFPLSPPFPPKIPWFTPTNWLGTEMCLFIWAITDKISFLWCVFRLRPNIDLVKTEFL